MGTYTKQTYRRPARPRSKRLLMTGVSASSATSTPSAAVEMSMESPSVINATVIRLGDATLIWDAENGVIKCNRQIVVSDFDAPGNDESGIMALSDDDL